MSRGRQQKVSKSQPEMTKVLDEIEQMKKKISLKERCSKAMNDKHAKQIKANSAIIDSLSSKNLDMRKEIFEKSKSDFGIFYERFHDRPKSETLPLRKKMFGDIKLEYREHINNLKTQLNKLRFMKKQKQEKLDALHVRLNTMSNTVEPKNESTIQTEALENKLDKVCQKQQLAKQIRLIYGKIHKELHKEVNSFPKKLKALQDQIKVIEDEFTNIRFYHSFAFEQLEESNKDKMSVQAEVRHEKRICDEMIKKLERQIRETMSSEGIIRSSETLQGKKGKRSPTRLMRDTVPMSKENTEADEVISDYEKKANLLKCATGISFWDFEKMSWCLSNQQNISNRLHQQTKNKQKTIKELNLKQDKLKNELQMLRFERDKSFEEKVEGKKEELVNVKDNISSQKHLIVEKNNLIEKVGQAFDYLAHFLVRKILLYKMAIELPSTLTVESENATDEEKILHNLSALQTILYSLAQNSETMITHTESNVLPIEELRTSAARIHQNNVPDRLNSRIPLRVLETLTSEAEYDFQVPDNEDYTSRKKLKRRAEQIIRVNRRKHAL